ncbi:MAG TPA: polyphosphate kinase 2 [Bauldia sp.]|nr:polyphosphate kinase 2 [Bauldia sp.]
MAKGRKHKKAKPDRKKGAEDLPASIAPSVDAPPIRTRNGRFDLDDPELPEWVEERAFRSGGYPYDDHMDEDAYERQLKQLQIELVKLQRHVLDRRKKVVLVFEGRDAAGKGGAIFVFTNYLNPRAAHAVALPKPTEAEAGQWYFQRYVARLPTAGEIILFDRSWYNRAGVEAVMGFCTRDERDTFLQAAPQFEKMLVDQDVVLFKFWLEIGREMQLKRFHERRHNPLKIWKLSPIDYAALGKWDDYTKARDKMLAATDTAQAPWSIALANDKRRARLAIIRHVLSAFDYPGKDKAAVGAPDPRIFGTRELIG